MISSRTIVLITIIAMIMLYFTPIESMPTRQKRWTFNTWRLHGRRYTPHTIMNPQSESNVSSDSADVHNTEQTLNVDNDDSDDNDSYAMLFRLLQFFQTLEREQIAQNNDNIYFSKDLNA